MRTEKLFAEEGLFITDFSEEFFKEQTEENSDLKEHIDEKVKIISKKQKAENKTIWHCIFEEHVVKRYVHPVLLSKNKNQELLQDMPSRPFLDLAIIYMIHIPQDEMHGVIKSTKV